MDVSRRKFLSSASMVTLMVSLPLPLIIPKVANDPLKEISVVGWKGWCTGQEPNHIPWMIYQDKYNNVWKLESVNDYRPKLIKLGEGMINE